MKLLLSLIRLTFLVAVLAPIWQGGCKIKPQEEEKRETPVSAENEYLFTWQSDEQDIVPGTLYMRVKWKYDRKGDYLSFIISVNDNDYNEKDYIGMIFDKNQNGMIDLGTIDKPYGLWVNGMTAPSALAEDGSLVFAKLPPKPGGHKCEFDPEKGYVFEIPFIKWQSPLPRSTLLRISFVDRDVPYGKIRVVKTKDLKLNIKEVASGDENN
mgnify:CR=1 FL=1